MRFVLANGAIFIVMTGILSYQYFYQSPMEPVAAAPATSLRTPAATPTTLPSPDKVATTLTAKLSESDWKFNLNCKDSEKEVSQKQDSLILNLKKCEKDFPKKIVIENQTNGFTASVFAVNDSHSKTDSIPLTKGKNVIVIKYLLSKAKAKTATEVIEKLILQHD